MSRIPRSAVDGMARQVINRKGKKVPSVVSSMLAFLFNIIYNIKKKRYCKNNGLYMEYYDFEEKMKNYPVFTASEVKNVFFDQKNIIIQIAFWIKKGYLKKIKDGLYVLARMNDAINPMLFAGKIYAPSYLSMEFALNYHGIIPDIPGTYTSVTSRTTKYFKTDSGYFTYQKVKPEFFTGYETRTEKHISFSIANPEKALVDYVYLHKNKIAGGYDYWREMRIDEDFRFKKKKLELYTNILNDKKVNALIKEVLRYQKNAG